MNTDDIRSTAYSAGYEKGKRNADNQHLWGGRVTRKGQAEETARAFLKAREEGDDLDFIDNQTPPWCADGYKAVKAELGEAGLDAWKSKESLTDEEASDIISEEWMMGYTDGILDALEDDARSFLANL
jgi:hypothetical protein